MRSLTDELGRRRLDRLVRRLERELRNRRSFTCSADRLEDVQQWRRAARVAGRRMGISVRTGISRDGTKVWVSEGP